MVASTGACLAAARFGLAPSVKKQASAGLKLSDKDSILVTGDPAGA
jgi:photosystem I subunit X